MQKIISVFIVILTLAGCTTKRVVNQEKHRVQLGKGLSYELLAPVTFAQSLSLTQVAEISSQQGQHELVFVLQIEANEMTVVGLLPNGTRVFSIYFDGNVIRSDGYRELIEKLNPKYLLADIQLALWPLDVLQQQWLLQQECFLLEQCSISEQSLAADSSRMRSIMLRDVKLVSVEFSSPEQQPNSMTLINSERGYKITLEATD